MSENNPQRTEQDSGSPSGMFTPPPAREGSFPLMIWAIAGIVVLAVVGTLIFVGRHKAGPAANTALPLDPYAPSLAISDVAMSESTILSGGKSTFIDGHIRNTGSRTVKAATVQVFFRNDEGMPPAIDTLPISLVRTREPYVDTQPISAAPIRPGEDREFRLIFETIPGNWNVQLPEIHLVHVSTE